MATVLAPATTRTWLAPLLLGLAAFALYTINLERPTFPDELYHLLAARGLVETGEPRIAEGLYTRGYLFTWLVAQSFTLFGESLTAGRLPSCLAMAGLVAALFLFLRREAGALAAWLGAGLFAVSPFAVDLAQFVRFYAIQCLAFFLAACLLYRLFAAWEEGPGRRLYRLVMAGALLGLALYFQVTTLIGVVGLAAWCAVSLALGPWGFTRLPRTRQLQLLALLAILGGGLLLALWASGLLQELWFRYRWTPLFNRKTEDQFWFYHGWYSLLYPSLWPLTGLFSLLVVAVRPRLGSFLLTVFAIGFLLNSFAAAKSLRYFSYAQPFLFALWGVALAEIAAPLGRFGRDLIRRLQAVLAELTPWPLSLARALVLGAVLFLLAANAAWLRTVTLIADIPVPPELPATEWPLARPALEPLLARVDVVVTTEELGTLYYLGHYDILMSASKLEELGPPPVPEFSRDERTGRPVIAEAASLARLIDCRASGLFITQSKNWGTDRGADPEAERLLQARARPVPLPPRSRLLAFVWEHPAANPPPEARCADLPGRAGGRG